ncbi:imidazole glycerol phosphate synthase subunit HisH [bacterium]|nr:imidazole glycerol phosphate synthase subunit HisH [bacterium]
MTIGIVDYGVGNVASVQAAFRRLGVRSILSSEKDVLSAAKGLVLPGVGAFPVAMQQIHAKGLAPVILDLAIEKCKPLLGICLGMQILADWGDEYEGCQGLGLIPGRVKMLKVKKQRKVPHVGWSGVAVHDAGRTMFSRTESSDAYYFDHSYCFEAPQRFRAATVAWDGEIVAAVARDNIWGVQFHPEKSQNSGLRLLKAFCFFVEQGISR